MPGEWTEKGAPTAWPARSPDFTGFFFYPVGAMKGTSFTRSNTTKLGTAYSDLLLQLLFQIIIQGSSKVTPCLIRRLSGAWAAALETGISLHRGLVENHGGVRSPGTLTDSWRRALETEHLSMGTLWGEPGGGILYWGPWRLCRGRLWWRASLSIGAPLGNLEGGSCTGSAVPRNFVWGGGSTNSVDDRGQRERGSGDSSPLLRGSGGSCNLVQEISFHIVKFS